MTSPNMMYAGGPSGDPYMGLLGTINPQTSGLLQVPQQAQAMPAMMQSYQPQSFGTSPGTNWSQAAYQMAGSPNQNPFSGGKLPPATAASTPSGGGATALGGTALGILGALGKAAGTNSPLGNAISGLMGGSGNPFGTYTTGNIANVGNVGGSSIASSGAAAAAPYTSGLLSDAATQAGVSGIAPVGTGAIDAAADAGASAAIPGLDAGADAAGGLLGGDTAAAAASPALESVGTGAIDAAADAGASGAADAGAGSAGLGAGAGAAAGLGLALAPALIGMETNPVSLTGKFWSGFNNPTGTYGSGTGNYTQNYLQLANLISQGDTPPSGLLSQYPGVQQAAAQLGAYSGQQAYGKGGSTGKQQSSKM